MFFFVIIGAIAILPLKSHLNRTAVVAKLVESNGDVEVADDMLKVKTAEKEEEKRDMGDVRFPVSVPASN